MFFKARPSMVTGGPPAVGDGGQLSDLSSFGLKGSMGSSKAVRPRWRMPSVPACEETLRCQVHWGESLCQAFWSRFRDVL